MAKLLCLSRHSSFELSPPHPHDQNKTPLDAWRHTERGKVTWILVGREAMVAAQPKAIMQIATSNLKACDQMLRSLNPSRTRRKSWSGVRWRLTEIDAVD